jgi:hypothetical protein
VIDAAAVLDRFLEMLGHDSDTAMIPALVAPYRMVVGPEEAVKALDKLAQMWAAAKGVPV